MPRPIHHTTTRADLEVRGSQRLVCGIAVPFDKTIECVSAGRSVTELFKFGAFARTIRERGDKVKFCVVHDQQSPPIGRAHLLREDAVGLYCEMRVSQTERGDEALELIRDGALDSLSIGFRDLSDSWDPGATRIERTEVRLEEVSAVAFPAYEDAVILGVRSGSLDERLAELRSLDPHAVPPGRPSTLARRELELLEFSR